MYRWLIRLWVIWLFAAVTYAQDTTSISYDDRIFIEQGNQIWLLDPATLEQESFINPNLAIDEMIGDISPALNDNAVYFLVGPNINFRATIPSINVRNRLIRYDINSSEERVILEDTQLARISSISPDGIHAILMFADIFNPINSRYCLIDLSNGVCTFLNIPIELNNFFWLDSRRFVTIQFEGINIYRLAENGLELDGTVNDPNYLFYVGDISSQTGNLIVAASQVPSYLPRFLEIDIQNVVLSSMEIDPSQNVPAAFNGISLSGDGAYLAYKRSTTLEIIDSSSGDHLAQIEDVQDFMWIPNQNSLLITTDDLSTRFEYKLERFDIGQQDFTLSRDLVSPMRFLANSIGLREGN